MAVREAKFVGADRYDFSFGKALNLVKIPLYHVHVAGRGADAAEELESFLTAEVASAQDVLDFSGS